VLSQKTEKVALLIKYGAKVNPSGEALLKLAQKRKNSEIVELLKSTDAKE